ncbi:MAG TPA: DUF6174 domain-containing protein [Nostocaceae cyanobacterium]|nr:DUF6174 domain-containing protein [Nostocaceae cyanobacterium]
MRLPLAIATALVVSLGLTTPALSRPVFRPTAARPANSNSQQLKVNQKLWNQQNISNYRYTLSRSCFCTPEARGPVVVEVRNGVTTSVTSVATGQPVDPELFKQYDSVPELFGVIKDAIARKASSLTVQYEPKFGYPTQISIDYSAQIADEELYLTVENFEVLP